MLTAEGCRARRDRLWAALEPKPDVLLLAEPLHLTWLCGFYASQFVFSSVNAPAYLIMRSDGSSSLIVDNIAQGLAKEAFVDSVVPPAWYWGLESAGIRRDILNRAVVAEVHRSDAARIGIDSALPASIVNALEEDTVGTQFPNVSGVIHEIRRRKDPDELEAIRSSIRAMEAGLTAAVAGLKPGMTELKAFEIVQQGATEAAGKPVLVYGDFVTGERTQKGGGPPTNYVIQPNDLVLLDFSVVIQGYRGDFANTWVVDGGKPTPGQRRIESACIEAMATGESMLWPGIACTEIDAAMRRIYVNHGLPDGIGHHLGHGLGLGHPDPPYIVPESADTLMAGDVVTLEPGQYVQGVGGMRFERNYLITESGVELLTHHHIGLQPNR